MSDLERSFAKAKLAGLPPPSILFGDSLKEEDGEEYLDDPARPVSNTSTDSSSSASSTGTVKPSLDRKLFERPEGTASRSKSSPLPWQDFFSQELYLDQHKEEQTIRHHVYVTPPTGSGPVFVTHHGAGSSGLSFATFAKEIIKLIPNAGILSPDARHHGETTVTNNSDSKPASMNLSLNTLVNELTYVVGATGAEIGWARTPDIILIGHSLGGAVVTELAHQQLLGTSIIGYAVLDVVEGSAMDALQSMDQYLSMRPRSFPSLASGIEWHIRSRTIRNTLSARVSVPALIYEDADSTWKWRTDLRATKPFWENWFVGLSQKFLTSRGGKLLILAGTDRLDKELMIGQMQGKYQLQVFPDAGHFVQEDQPGKTAQIVADFYHRNDRSAIVLPPKVDDLIKQGKLKPPGS